MTRFLLTRIVPVVAILCAFFGGMLLLLTPAAGLSQRGNPFHGTDLEQFDVEGDATARAVLAAFRQGYPSKVTDCGYDTELGDWFIVAGRQKFLWARGRILPERLLREEGPSVAEQWRPVVDYLYPEDVAAPETFSRELVAEIRRVSRPEFRSSQPPYHLDFFDALYDGKYQVRMERNIVSTAFLGRRVNVHRDIVPALSQVEGKILSAAGQSREVREFVAGVGSVEGYNWREIRDRQDRSFHSWGLAVDILPVGWQQENVYWSWLSERNPDWMMVPLPERWMPPAAVVEIFERHGFVWGGKWMLWDTIHFEYRPELLVLRDGR